MTIYLYIKTHDITGLKYLGQTASKDPYSYPGSGTYWKQHLKKHGHFFSTEIIKECNTKEEVKEYGIYYSVIFNVVESDEWANLMIEQGDGGRQSEESRIKISNASRGRVPWNKGKAIWSDLDRKRISEQNRTRGAQSKNTGKRRTDEQKLRSSLAQKGRKLTEEHKQKLRKPKQKR